MTRTMVRVLMAAAAGGLGLLWSGEISPNPETALISTAQARIGRPLTPMSYAGVARRTTRRAVAVGAATAGAAYYAAPAATCVQAVDAYGRVYYRC
jgi:hypothetical protein